MKDLFVITGCDSGIGKNLAWLLHKKGFAVAVSYLEKNPFNNIKNIFTCKMDLEKEEGIDLFATFIKDCCSKGYLLRCLVNNAGIALGGPVENIPMTIFRKVFEINFFGMITLIKSMIPHIIESKGMIVIIGSMAGRIAMPFLSPYVSTKFALHGFSDSLRRELNPFGIRTVLIEPASIATPIWNKAKQQDISFIETKYQKSTNIFMETFVDSGNYGMEVKNAAEKIFTIIMKNNPKSNYIIASNRITTYIQSLIPAFIMDKIVKKTFSMDYGDEPLNHQTNQKTQH